MARHSGFPSPRANGHVHQRDSSLPGRIMGFMKRFRSRSKLQEKEKASPQRAYNSYAPAVRYHGPDLTANLPDKVLREIFSWVCPHSTDESYDVSEDVVTDGCMLCDMRDLANCALVKRQWYGVAAGQLYKSIRLDPVHYCELEEIYADQRRRKSRNGEAIDPPTQRLQQLCRTVRENHHIASRVRFLKLSYMTREACKADLARTVSVLPNLEYVDLPDGFFTGDSMCHTLRQELQARCPHIRKMKYNEGSEQSLEQLLHGHWQELRVVEISKLRADPSLLRRAFGALPWLMEITLADLPHLNDSVFHSAPGIPEFPALETLTLNHVPNITIQGLSQYLSNPLVAQTLKAVNIKDSGIRAEDLHQILHLASNLQRLTFIATVTSSLQTNTPLPPLASRSLCVLNFEIVDAADTPQSLFSPAQSYYQYLTNSLLASALPALRQLYVRDPNLAETLTLPPPIRPFADAGQAPPRFAQQLEVFSKGLDELEWVFTEVQPADAYGRRGSLSGGRPLSSYSASRGLGPQWGGEARKSIVVGNGFGGFLAVPVDDGRPKSAGNFSAARPNHAHTNSLGGVRASWMSHAGREKRGSRADLWR